jgi:cytochrome c oxidase assembly factor CtaG
MGGMAPVGFSLHNALTRWQLGPFALCVLAALVAIGAWYLRADWRLASRGRAWSRWRTLSFLLGLVAVDLAVQSPVATFTGSYFEAHVVQHLLLMIIAPPLLALGAPSTLLLQTASRATKTRWLRVLRSEPFAVLTHPVTVWSLYYGVMFVFFLTPLINVAMHHMDLMDVLNLSFFFGGTLFWWPMVGIDPIIHWKLSYPFRLLTVLLGAGLEAFLGVAILDQSHPIASMYTLSSTKAGGGILWAGTELGLLVAAAPILVQWMRSEQRAGRRHDAATVERQPAGTPLATSEAGPGPLARRDGPMSAWEAAWLAKNGAVPVTGRSTEPVEG